MSHLTEQWEWLLDQAENEGAIDPSLSTPVLVRRRRRLFLPGYEDLLTSHRAAANELVHTLTEIIPEVEKIRVAGR